MNGGCCIHSFRLSRIRIIWNDRAMIRSIKSCDFNFILLLSLQSREYRGDIEENYSTANFGCCNYLKKKNLWTEFFFRKSVNKIDKIIEAGGEGNIYNKTNVYFLIDIIFLFLFQRYWNAFCNINMFRLFMTSICVS